MAIDTSMGDWLVLLWHLHDNTPLIVCNSKLGHVGSTLWPPVLMCFSAVVVCGYRIVPENSA